MSEITPVTEEKKENDGLLSQITNAFSSATPNPEGVGPEIGEVPQSETAPAVVSTEEPATEVPVTEVPVTETSVDTTDVSTDETDVQEPLSMPESESTLDEAESTTSVLAPLDASTGTKKKRKKRKKCKCPTKKNNKLPKCKRGSQRSKKTKKCKSKKKCGKGTRRDPATGVCKPK